MIKSKKWDVNDKNRVTIAALKLLELISCRDIDEFNLHKWAFQIERLQIHNTETIQKIQSPFLVQPYLLQQIPETSLVKFDDSNEFNLKKGDKRKIMIDKNQMNDDTLKKKTQEFLQYVIMLQTSNLPMDPQDLETLIQSDFIEFGEFINL